MILSREQTKACALAGIRLHQGNPNASLDDIIDSFIGYMELAEEILIGSRATTAEQIKAQADIDPMPASVVRLSPDVSDYDDHDNYPMTDSSVDGEDYPERPAREFPQTIGAPPSEERYSVEEISAEAERVLPDKLVLSHGYPNLKHAMVTFSRKVVNSPSGVSCVGVTYTADQPELNGVSSSCAFFAGTKPDFADGMGAVEADIRAQMKLRFGGRIAPSMPPKPPGKVEWDLEPKPKRGN